MTDNRCANIMVLGHTGAGKSSFINYLVSRDSAKTGNGKPVTQNFDTYWDYDAFGLPTCIYDSKGFEVGEYQKIADDTIRFINDKCNSDDIYQWIHTVFYCINRTRARLDDSEISLIKRIQSETMRTPHIVLTNCDESAQDEAMKGYIAKTIGYGTKIYCVNSVETRTRRGATQQFGRKAIMEGIFEILWFDMLRVMAKDIAKDFRQNFQEGMNEFKDLLQARTSPTNYDEDKFKEVCVGLLKNHIRRLKNYNEAIVIIAMEKIKSYTEFLNEYGEKERFAIDRIAVNKAVNNVSERLEEATDFVRNLHPVERDVSDEIIRAVNGPLFLPNLIINVILPILKESDGTKSNSPYHEMCVQVTKKISSLFPSRGRLEKELLDGMLDEKLRKKMKSTESENRKKYYTPPPPSPPKEKEVWPETIINDYGNRAEAITVVKNKYGLFVDAREASIFVQTAQKFKSKVHVNFRGKTLDAKSILMMMPLSFQRGEKFPISAEGPDAFDAVRSLADLVDSKFGEE